MLQQKNVVLAIIAVLVSVCVGYACWQACNPDTHEVSCESDLLQFSLEQTCGGTEPGASDNPFAL